MSSEHYKFQHPPSSETGSRVYVVVLVDAAAFQRHLSRVDWIFLLRNSVASADRAAIERVVMDRDDCGKEEGGVGLSPKKSAKLK
jgi:hypothetical protein